MIRAILDHAIDRIGLGGVAVCTALAWTAVLFIVAQVVP